MQQKSYTTGIALFSDTTAVRHGLFRVCRMARGFAAASMMLLAVDGVAQAQDQPAAAAGAAAAPNLPMPRIKTYAPPGFRVYRPGYRLAGRGVLVTAQLCRLPGYATAGPQHVRIELLDAAGTVAESHEQYLPRLGMRFGNNCSSTGVHLDAVPNYGETIKICAGSGKGACP